MPHVKRPPTAKQQAEIRAGNAAGETLTSIAARLGISKSLVSEWAASQVPPLSWARAGQTASAAQARSAKAAEIRSQLELDFALDAQTFRAKREQPFIYVFTGGTCQMEQPYPADQRAYQQMAIASWKASQEIADRRASAGLGAAKSLLGDLAAAMGVDTSPYTGDDSEGDGVDEGA